MGRWGWRQALNGEEKVEAKTSCPPSGESGSLLECPQSSRVGLPFYGPAHLLGTARWGGGVSPPQCAHSRAPGATAGGTRHPAPWHSAAGLLSPSAWRRLHRLAPKRRKTAPATECPLPAQHLPCSPHTPVLTVHIPGLVIQARKQRLKEGQ